jgi:hypothetical protein
VTSNNNLAWKYPCSRRFENYELRYFEVLESCDKIVDGLGNKRTNKMLSILAKKKK